jgi:hypothetical protein
VPQLITRAFRWLRSRPRATRIVISIGVPTGIACIILGVWLDSVDWWPRHGYFLNLFSGLTGACFGVPFALVGLDYLVRNQEEHREAERNRARTAAEVDAFVTSLLEVCNGRGLDDVATRVQNLSAQNEVVRSLPFDDPDRDAAVGVFLAAFEELIPAPRADHRVGFRSFIRHSDEMRDMRLWRTGVQKQWDRLDRARSQISGAWIDKATEIAGHQAVDYLLKEGRNPWFSSRGAATAEKSGPTVMRHFLTDMKALCAAAKAMEVHTQ